jgi:hypothetical protein
VAIRVTGLLEAERYYRTIFGLQVAFREAEVADGWRTLPVGPEWEDAEAAGIPLSMCFLARDGFRLALEEAPNLGPDQGKHPSRKPPAYKSQRSGLGLQANTLQTSRTWDRSERRLHGRRLLA